MGARHDQITALAAQSRSRLDAIEADSRRGDDEKREAAATERREFSKDIARYKARECAADLIGKLPLAIDLGDGRNALILTAETLPNDDAVRITVRVEQDGKDVTPAGLNPWTIVNPPMLVQDAAGEVEISSEADSEEIDHWSVDEDGEPIAIFKPQTITRRYREDPAENIAALIRLKLRGR
jgi:hypothetical protein